MGAYITTIIPLSVLVISFLLILWYMIGRMNRKMQEEISSLEVSRAETRLEAIVFSESLRKTEEELFALTKILKKEKGEKNQLAKVAIDLRDIEEFVIGLKVEFQVMSELQKGALGKEKFTIKLGNPVENRGVKEREALDEIFACFVGPSFHFYDGNKAQSGDSFFVEEIFELDEEGRNFFSDPHKCVSIYFPKHSCFMVLWGTESEIQL